jgi:hypothetical protein
MEDFSIRLKVKVLPVQNTKVYMGELRRISNFLNLDAFTAGDELRYVLIKRFSGRDDLEELENRKIHCPNF